MTPRERRNPDLLNGSRRKRIALGSGTQVSDVNRLVKQFDQSRQMMKQIGGGKEAAHAAASSPECCARPHTTMKAQHGKNQTAPHGRQKATDLPFRRSRRRARRATAGSSKFSVTTTRARNRKTVEVDEEKAKEWLGKGAQPSETVRRLVCRKGHHGARPDSDAQAQAQERKGRSVMSAFDDEFGLFGEDVRRVRTSLDARRA